MPEVIFTCRECARVENIRRNLFGIVNNNLYNEAVEFLDSLNYIVLNSKEIDVGILMCDTVSVDKGFKK